MIDFVEYLNHPWKQKCGSNNNKKTKVSDIVIFLPQINFTVFYM